MSVTADYPPSLPLPSVPGYQLERMANILRTPMEAGHARQRRRTLDSPTDIDATFELDAWEFMVFDGWKKHTIADGAAWFNIELLASIGLTNHVARIKEGKAPARLRPGGNWIVTAKLEIREAPTLSAGDTAELVSLTGEELFAAIASIHHTIHHDLVV